jgi:hypothetical protein
MGRPYFKADCKWFNAVGWSVCRRLRWLTAVREK